MLCQVCDPNQFSMENTEVSFNTIHYKLVDEKYPACKLTYQTPRNIELMQLV